MSSVEIHDFCRSHCVLALLSTATISWMTADISFQIHPSYLLACTERHLHTQSTADVRNLITGAERQTMQMDTFDTLLKIKIYYTKAGHLGG